MVMHVLGIKGWFGLCGTIIVDKTFRIPMLGSLKQVCQDWKLELKELYCDSNFPCSVRDLVDRLFQTEPLKTRHICIAHFFLG